MNESKLADVYVQFSAKGAEEVSAKVKALNDDLGKLSGVIQGAFAASTATVMGFVTAGMAGTVQAQQLTFQMAELSRTIAGIFQPEITAVIQTVRDITAWLRSLSDETLASIAYWAKFAFAFGTVVLLAPKIVGAIKLIIAALQALTKANIVALAFSGPKGWAMLAAGAVIAGVAVGAGHAFGSMGDNKPGSRRSLAQSVSGFEAVEASYSRVAQGSLTAIGGRSLPEQQLDEAKETNRLLGDLNKETKNKPPIVDNRR